MRTIHRIACGLIPLVGLMAAEAGPDEAPENEPAAQEEAAAAEGDEAGAEDGADEADAAAEPAPEPEPTGWQFNGTVGAFLNSTATDNAESSRDSTIAGSNENTAFNLKLDLNWLKEEGDWRYTHDFKARYGETREDGQDWEESDDEVRYDGRVDYILQEPSFIYGAWGFESVFTGAEPDKEYFDPFLIKASVGYGQRYEPAGFEKSFWMWRAGVRAQREFGRGLGDEGREIETGWEFVTEYKATPKEDLSVNARLESFGEFEDSGHITNLLNAGVNYKLHEYLSMAFEWRLYYESEPEDAPAGAEGYDEFSWRQIALIGLLYEW